MITPSQVLVGTTPTVLATVPRGTVTVVLTNTGSQVLAVGLSDLMTTSSGAPVPPGGVVQLLCQPGSAGETLYGMVATGTATVGVFLSQ